MWRFPCQCSMVESQFNRLQIVCSDAQDIAASVTELSGACGSLAFICGCRSDCMPCAAVDSEGKRLPLGDDQTSAFFGLKLSTSDLNQQPRAVPH